MKCRFTVHFGRTRDEGGGTGNGSYRSGAVIGMAASSLGGMAVDGRKHEFDMMPESGRTGDVLVQPQGAG
jgi:hypothetical protein